MLAATIGRHPRHLVSAKGVFRGTREDDHEVGRNATEEVARLNRGQRMITADMLAAAVGSQPPFGTIVGWPIMGLRGRAGDLGWPPAGARVSKIHTEQVGCSRIDML